MISKIIGILLVGLLMATVFPVGSATYIFEVDDFADADLEYLYPVMSIPIPIQHPEDPDTYSTITLIDTPAEFSWKNYDGVDLTTSAKNQGNCGSCWAFGAMSAIESLVNIREGYKNIDLDLSEQYLLSCIPAAGSCSGGRSASPFGYIFNLSEDNNFLNGVIFEECLPYQADDSIPCSSKADHWLETLVPLSGYGEVWLGPNNADAVDLMKSQIYANGPIYALMFVDDSFRYFGGLFHRSTDYFRYKPSNAQFLNHAVLVLGWKDDASIRNGGYWICKNSWGTEWGYDGFFNIEYGSQNIQYYIAWPEYDPDSFDCPPVADAGGFLQGTVDEHLIFDGSMSLDDENDNLEYVWDFGDGTTGKGAVISHEFADSGIYQVVLTVTDDHNHISSDVILVGIDEDLLSVECSGGYGLTIVIENHLDFPVQSSLLSIEVLGAHQNMDYRTEQVPVISSRDTYSLVLPIIGLGKGALQLNFNNFVVTKQFFSLGPFVFVR